MSYAYPSCFKFPFRVVYMVEAYKPNGELVFRRYAQNKSIACSIASGCVSDDLRVSIRKLCKIEHNFVNPAWVETVSR